MAMQLQKAFDPQALANAMKAQGIADAEKLVNDMVPIFFDWVNASVAMAIPAPLGVISTTVLAQIEELGSVELQKFEATLQSKA